CVEVGSAPGAALVRDSKQHGAGPVLGFAVAGWRAFTAGVLAGTFER
ncbi:MAG: DUF397 domain-containing protein, partial [Sciscionella sp.]